jgi:hypothetical protein
MINHEVPHQSYSEVATQIAQYFDITDATPLMADTNKRYSYTQNSSYSPSCPTKSTTTVIISPTADNVADIYNGFIYAEMAIRPTSSVVPPTGCITRTWIGFKDAMDAVEKYDIQANGVTIYTQNNAAEESFVTNCASPQSVKSTDVFSKATHKNIWNYKYGPQCGVWVDWANYDGDIPYIIKLKIDLRRFLPLSNLKYLPAFAGKIELRLTFGTAGLVVANHNPLLLFNGVTEQAKYNPCNVTAEFVQIGDSILVPTTITAPTSTANGKVNMAEWIIRVPQGHDLIACETNINCFGLNQIIYDSLIQRYSQKVLTFPTQIMQFNSMSSKLSSPSSKATQTLTPRFIDSIFLLFPTEAHHKTVFKNPMLSTFQLGCAGYGQFPSIAFGTIREPRLVEMVTNALNLNSDTAGLSRDVLNSLVQDFYPNDGQPPRRIDGQESDDRTNFLIGIPTETDNTFQQGQTSNTPINYGLTVTQNPSNPYKNTNMTPIMGVLIDATFNIMINNNGQPPIVTIGPNDITSPVMVS